MVAQFAAQGPPGGGVDLSARLVADSLSAKLGQQVVVENRPGATGTIGSDYVAKSPADGYTLLWTSTDSITIVPAPESRSLTVRQVSKPSMPGICRSSNIRS